MALMQDLASRHTNGQQGLRSAGCHVLARYSVCSKLHAYELHVAGSRWLQPVSGAAQQDHHLLPQLLANAMTQVGSSLTHAS